MSSFVQNKAIKQHVKESMSQTFITIQQIRESFPKQSEKSLKYIEFHQYRYQFLLQTIYQMMGGDIQRNVRILDIGPSFQTVLIRKSFPNATVDTLGFPNPVAPPRPHEMHIQQDLNNTQKAWALSQSAYDLIVFCEVIEHLYTPPDEVLKRFQKALVAGGSIVIQTPNAAAIHKRIRMMLGKNPYDLLQPSKMGHFREYTRSELQDMLSRAGFRVQSIHMKNYFNNHQTPIHWLFSRSEKIIPSTMRDGITIIGEKQGI